MIEQFTTILVLGGIGILFIWSGFLALGNRNKKWVDKTIGLDVYGNTSRENIEGIASIICGSVLASVIIYFYAR